MGGDERGCDAAARRAHLDERRGIAHDRPDSRRLWTTASTTSNQLDIKLAKRFTVDKVRLRVDFDLYNVFNSSWPYTVTTTYSNTTASQWQRPTNVLQNRFFKLGGHISF